MVFWARQVLGLQWSIYIGSGMATAGQSLWFGHTDDEYLRPLKPDLVRIAKLLGVPKVPSKWTKSQILAEIKNHVNARTPPATAHEISNVFGLDTPGPAQQSQFVAVNAHNANTQTEPRKRGRPRTQAGPSAAAGERAQAEASTQLSQSAGLSGPAGSDRTQQSRQGTQLRNHTLLAKH